MSYTHNDYKSICVAVIPTPLSVLKIPFWLLSQKARVCELIEQLSTVVDGCPWAGWNPTSGAEAFPHTDCQSILVCAERILLDWWGQTGRQTDPGSVWHFFFLLGEAFHQLQLLHWFPLLIDGDELQRSTGIKNEASPNWFKSVTPT